jgi:hypothetical protein
MGKDKPRSGLALGVCIALMGLNTSVHADDVPAPDERNEARTQQEAAGRRDARALSGAEAADEARIFTARLRRCEGFSGAQRDACVEAARRRLEQL